MRALLLAAVGTTLGSCALVNGLSGADSCVAQPDGSCVLPKSCLDAKTAASGLSPADGLYDVDLDGDGSMPATQVYCDMNTDGGGWTLVANATLAAKAATEDVLVTLESDAWLDDDRYSRLYENATAFRAIGSTTQRAFHLSKAEAAASNCDDALAHPPVKISDNCAGQPQLCNLFWGLKTSNCSSLTGNDYAGLSLTRKSTGQYVSLMVNPGATLWHYGSPGGELAPAGADELEALEAALQVWIR